MSGIWKVVLVATLATSALCLRIGKKSGDDQSFASGTFLPNDYNVLSDVVLLVAWEPQPIDLWNYIVLNTSDQTITKRSRVEITQFTKENFPDITLVFTCSKGDFSYFPNDLRVPVIGVDSFENDFYFQQYLNIIYTMHGFSNPTELWANFFKYPEAFDPVRIRISSTFQEYIDNYSYNQIQQEQDDEKEEEYLYEVDK